MILVALLDLRYVPRILDSALLMSAHQCSLEGKDHLLQLAADAVPNAAQEAAGLLYCMGMLLAHVQKLLNVRKC